MIRQYLPQTNESATVAKSKIFSHLNKAADTPGQVKPGVSLLTVKVQEWSLGIRSATDHEIMERTLCSTVHAMVAWRRTVGRSPQQWFAFSSSSSHHLSPFISVPPALLSLSARAKMSASLSEKLNATWHVSMLCHMLRWATHPACSFVHNPRVVRRGAPGQVRLSSSSSSSIFFWFRCKAAAALALQI